MPQLSRPISDGSVGLWTTQAGTTTGLYDTIDESIVDDTDYIQSDESDGDDVAVFPLQAMVPPGAGSGTIEYEFGASNLDVDRDLIIELLEQGLTIQSWTESDVQPGWNHRTQIITASITHPEALSIKVTKRRLQRAVLGALGLNGQCGGIATVGSGTAVAAPTPVALSVPVWDVFEASTTISGSTLQAGYEDVPYSAAAPAAGLDYLAGKGITVDGLFLPPGQSDWGSAIVVPAFWHQQWTYGAHGAGWVYPSTNASTWTVRFAVQSATQTDVWMYRFRVVDGNGTVYSPLANFTATAPTSKGFIRVSPTDSRFFQYDNGDCWPGVGTNGSVTEPANTTLQLNRAGGLGGTDVLRCWNFILSGNLQSSIRLFPTRSVDQGPDSGIAPAPSGGPTPFAFLLDTAYAVTPILWLTGNYFTINNTYGASVKPSTDYRITLSARSQNWSGSGNGITVKYWGSFPDSNLATNLAGQPPLTPYVKGDTPTTVTGTYRTGSATYILQHLYVVMEGAAQPTRGWVYDIKCQEILAGGALGPNLLQKSSGDCYLRMDSAPAWVFDYALQLAQTNGVTIKPVINEKSDQISDAINPDGTLLDYTTTVNRSGATTLNISAMALAGTTMTVTTSAAHHRVIGSKVVMLGVTGFGDTRCWQGTQTVTWVSSDGLQFRYTSAYGSTGSYSGGGYLVLSNYYQPGPMRWIQTANWRMWAARFGAYRSLHSWELENEGDLGGPHAGLVEALALAMHGTRSGGTGYDVARHPVSTSYWSVNGFDNTWWGNANIPDIDFVDRHFYTGTGPGAYNSIPGQGDSIDLHLDTAHHMEMIAAQSGAQSSGGVGKPQIVGEWFVLNSTTNPNGMFEPLLSSSDTNGVFLHNSLFGRLASQGVYAMEWYDDVGPVTTNNLWGLRKHLHDFLSDVPRHNGTHVDIAATAPAGVRVVGMKDTTNQRAHFWIFNTAHTWSNANGTFSALSGNVLVTGFAPYTIFNVERWEWPKTVGEPNRTSLQMAADATGVLTFALGTFLNAATVDAAVKLSVVAGRSVVGSGGANGRCVGTTTRRGSTTGTLGARGLAGATAGATHLVSVGNGYSDVTPKQLARTSDGTLWVATWDQFDNYPQGSTNGLSQHLTVRKGSPGASFPSTFSRMDQAHEPTGVVSWSMACMAGDMLGIAWVDRTAWSAGTGTDTNLRFSAFNTLTGLWGTVVTIDNAVGTSDIGQGDELVSLAVNTSGNPRIVYLKGATRRVTFVSSEDGGATWSGGTTVDDQSLTGNQRNWHPGLVYDAAGRRVITWWRGTFNGTADGQAFMRTCTEGGSGSTLISTDFEGGSPPAFPSPWSIYAQTNGTAVVDATAALSGTYGAHLTKTGTSNSGRATVIASVAAPASKILSMKFSVKIQAITGSGFFEIADFWFGGGASNRGTILGNANGTWQLYCRNQVQNGSETGVSLSAAGQTALAVGATATVILTYDYNATPTHTCYVNGAQVAQIVDPTLGTPVVPSTVALQAWEESWSVAGEIYVDNVTVADYDLGGNLAVWGTTHAYSAASQWTGIDQGAPVYVDGSNRYHVTFLDGSKDIVYRYSDDLGATWNTNAPGANQIGDDPAVGPGSAGNVRIYAHGPETSGAISLSYWEGAGGAASWGTRNQYQAKPGSGAGYDCSINVRWAQYFWYYPSRLDIMYWASDYPTNTLWYGSDTAAGPVIAKQGALESSVGPRGMCVGVANQGSYTILQNTWTQFGHDAQRSSYNRIEPSTFTAAPYTAGPAWHLAFTWNGPDATGTGTNHIYGVPWMAVPVCSPTLLFCPAGGSGLYAIALNSSGFLTSSQYAWRFLDGTVNCSPAYDPTTQSLLVGCANGNVYRLDAATGAQIGSVYAAGSGIFYGLAIVGDSVYVTCADGRLHRVTIATMARAWRYVPTLDTLQYPKAGQPRATTMPAYSASRDVWVYGTDDLYVHFVDNATGSAKYTRHKPTTRIPGLAPENAVAGNTWEGTHPVIAEGHGLAFMHMSLPKVDGGKAGPNPGGLAWGGNIAIAGDDNRAARTWLTANAAQWQSFFAYNLDTGLPAFIPNVGYSYGEYSSDYCTPVMNWAVKTWPNGDEVCYVAYRTNIGNPQSGTYAWNNDTNIGEMVLDSTTVTTAGGAPASLVGGDGVAGRMVAGDCRWTRYPLYGASELPGGYADGAGNGIWKTDEQNYVTVAGSTVFHAHWLAFEGATITNRGQTLGFFNASPIAMTRRPNILRSVDANQGYTTTHDNATRWVTGGWPGVQPVGDGRVVLTPGWYECWNVNPSGGGSSPQGYNSASSCRYMFVSGSLVIAVGSGGEILAFTHNGTIPPE